MSRRYHVSSIGDTLGMSSIGDSCEHVVDRRHRHAVPHRPGRGVGRFAPQADAAS
jgi:hypothetical protein